MSHALIDMLHKDLARQVDEYLPLRAEHQRLIYQLAVVRGMMRHLQREIVKARKRKAIR